MGRALQLGESVSVSGVSKGSQLLLGVRLRACSTLRARTDLLTALLTGVPGSGPSWFFTSVQRWIRLVLDDGSVALGLSSAIDVEAYPAATTTIDQASRLLYAVREQVLKKRERTDSNMASVRCSSPRSTVDST